MGYVWIAVEEVIDTMPGVLADDRTSVTLSDRLTVDFSKKFSEQILLIGEYGKHKTRYRHYFSDVPEKGTGLAYFDGLV